METKAGQSVTVRVWCVPTPSPGHRARTQQAAGKTQACFFSFLLGSVKDVPYSAEYNFNHPATLLSCVDNAILEKSGPKLNCIQLFVVVVVITEAGG